MSVIIGIVYGMKEGEIVDAFLAGAADMVGVALVIGVSRGISVIMATTGLDAYVLAKASGVLVGMSPIIFTIVAYLIYMALTFFIPSTSGLAGLSMPIFGPLAVSLGFSPEVIISIFSAGSGIIIMGKIRNKNINSYIYSISINSFNCYDGYKINYYIYKKFRIS